MPIFEKREEFLPAKSGALGQTIQFEITRAFHIEQILLKVEIATDGATALATGSRWGDVLQNVSLTVSDSSNTRQVVNLSGGDLIELGKQESSVDYSTLNAHYTGSSTNPLLYVPINFVPQQLADPTKSSFLLPAPRFNQNPTLSIQLAPGSVVASGDITNVTITPLIVRRVVTVADWITYDSEIKFVEVALPQSTYNNYRFELDIPGSYTGILFRTWIANGTRGNISSGANQRVQLETLQTAFRTNRFDLMARQNAQSYALPFGGGAATTSAPETYGEYYFDFLTDQIGSSVVNLDSVLDANLYAATGAKVGVNMDMTGGTDAKMRVITRRLFGTLAPMKMIKPNA